MNLLSTTLLTLCLITGLFNSARAEEIKIQHKGLTLNAELKMAEGKTFKDGMVLIVHGYLAHYKMEIISAIQQALIDNERSSLAINLSLGIDNRHGFLGCEQPQRHLQDDALPELNAWVKWLRSKGVKQLAMIGHSRGANQLMIYALEAFDPEVSHIVMLAPGAAGTERGNKLYLDRFGKSIDEEVARAQKALQAGNGRELMKFDFNACPQADATAATFLSYWSKNNRFADFRNNLRKTPVPTLIIAGSADERQPNTPDLLESVINARIKLVVIEGAGHFFRDLNMEEAIEEAVVFLERD